MLKTQQFESNINRQACKKCGHVNYDLDADADQQKCRQCGFVMFENCFESGIQFTDTKIDGQLHDMSKMGKDNTKYAEECIATMIRDLKIRSEYPEYLERIGETPIRIMKFAYKAYFLDHGSNIHHYSAAALYIALRFQKAPFLLMDFSEKLCINLFKLARCYRKLAKFLNVTLKLNERLPSIDPSIYIPRFCKMLEFNEKVEQVKDTAIKLLKRMKLDWMSHGRRPSSLCGAAILIAARMHGFKRTTSEVCKVVFVCEETLRKRLEEFKETDVAKLTREKFDEIEDIGLLGRERDPPAFLKAIKNQQSAMKKIKPQEESEEEINKQLEDAASILQMIETQVKSTANDVKLKEGTIVGGYVTEEDEGDASDMEDQVNVNNEEIQKVDQKLIQNDGNMDINSNKTQEEVLNSQQDNKNQQKERVKDIGALERVKPHFDEDDMKNQICLNNEDGLKLNVIEELSDMSDEEANLLILSNEEHAVKSILWHSMNEKWLREQSRKDPKEEKKEGKKRNKRRNDQLMNEEDPVDAIFKCKKIKDNLDEKKIREIYRQISNVKSMKLKDIFLSENPPEESLEISQKMLPQDTLFKDIQGYDLFSNRFTHTSGIAPQPVSVQQDEDGYEYE